MSIDVKELFENVLGDGVNDFDLPPPSFEVMQCEILSYDVDKESIVVKMPMLNE